MKKMMFNDRYAQTEAVIKELKIQTRRLMKNQSGNLAGQIKYTKKGSSLVYVLADFDNGITEDCPYAIGEIVAVAQSYFSTWNQSDWDNRIRYKKFTSSYGVVTHGGWANKQFVFAEDMPYQIRILDVRAERLQDITEEDCLREGIYKDECKTYFNGYAFELTRCVGNCILASQWYKSPKNAFADLIDKISGKGTWQANPYVWRIEFELVETDK